MKRFEVTILEFVNLGMTTETTVVVEADDYADAMTKARPPHKARFGRTFTIKELP